MLELQQDNKNKLGAKDHRDLRGMACRCRSWCSRPVKTRTTPFREQPLVNAHLHEVHTMFCHVRISFMKLFVDEFATVIV